MIKPSNGLSVDAELVVGDKEEQINTDIGNTITEQTANRINNVYKNDPFIILLALIGWMLPSPGHIWQGFLILLPWVKRK